MQKFNLLAIKKSSDKKIASHWNAYDFSFLPQLDGLFEFKSQREIKIRAFILTIIVQVAFDVITPGKALQYIVSNKLEQFLTGDERWFFENAIEEDKINESWKSECVYTLLWALSVVDGLKDYSTLCDWDAIKEKLPFVSTGANPEVYLDKSVFNIRSEVELIEMLDIYSRLDYICDWCKINNIECPVNSAMIYERRYALIWLTQKIEWDNIECNSIY